MRKIRWGDKRLPTRFWNKTVVNAVTGCWEWTRPLDKDGYPQWFHVSGSGPTRVRERAHRHAYTILVGPIDAETLNHDCHVRHCVNPNKGHAATPMSVPENVREGKARIAHCPRGHAYTEANTIQVGKNNARGCRICYNDRSRAYWHTTRKERQKEQRRAAGYRGGFDETSTCPHGHPRTAENTYVMPKTGYKACRPCRSARSKEHQRKRQDVSKGS